MATGGYFFTFEGIEGSGKSTLISYLAKRLGDLGFEVETTREPGATNLGKDLRSILLSRSYTTPIDPLAELLLFFADRAQHISEIIQPALSSGKIVLCDRFVHSTIAYQAYGRGLSQESIATLSSLVLAELSPHSVFLLDIDVETSQNRISTRSDKDRMEAEAFSFHTRVRDGFLDIAKQNKDLFRIINGTQPIQDVRAKVLEEILSIINKAK